MRNCIKFLVLRPKHTSEIIRTLKEHLPFVFRGDEISAYAEMTKDLEVYSLDGIRYTLTDDDLKTLINLQK
jgi:hypothetical protein